jgi:hypothetical protein
MKIFNNKGFFLPAVALNMYAAVITTAVIVHYTKYRTGEWGKNGTQAVHRSYYTSNFSAMPNEYDPDSLKKY